MSHIPKVLNREPSDKPGKPFADMSPSARMTRMSSGSGSNVPPGGRDMIATSGESGDKMQFSQEGGRTYKGSMTKKITNKTFYNG